MALNGFWFCIGTESMSHVQMGHFLNIEHTQKQTRRSLGWFEQQGFLCCVSLGKSFALFQFSNMG